MGDIVLGPVKLVDKAPPGAIAKGSHRLSGSIEEGEGVSECRACPDRVQRRRGPIEFDPDGIR
jgi:hypothetical protein